jgi:hypothetical protein
MKLPEVLPKITSSLNAAEIPYMLTGSFASVIYGAPRSTQDIDLVIAPTSEQLQVFVGALPSDQYYADLEAALEAYKCQSLFNIIDFKSGWKIDLIMCKSRPFSQEEFSRRQQINVDGSPLFVARAEDVILAKLEWARLGQSQRQIDDVARITGIQWKNLDRKYLEKWVSQLSLEEHWMAALHAANVS